MLAAKAVHLDMRTTTIEPLLSFGQQTQIGVTASAAQLGTQAKTVEPSVDVHICIELTETVFQLAESFSS